MRALIDKTPKVLKVLPDEGVGWHVQYAFFARAGLTDAARRETATYDALIVDLKDLEQDLSI